MPLITVEMFEGRSLDQKRALVRELTEAFRRTCGEDAASRLRVIIHEVPTENWGIGGVLAADRDADGSTMG